MSRSKDKVLLVEDREDCEAIAYLMDPHVHWGNERKEWPVDVKLCGGVDKILTAGSISTWLKSRETDVLGIVIDADDDAFGRWRRLDQLCRPLFQQMPPSLPVAGMVCPNDEGKRLGIWIMPDNQSRGMLETFLQFLVPASSAPLWSYAKEAVGVATATKGAKCRDCHRDKACMHTYLAWQDPPGPDFGIAITRGALDSRSDAAAAFVAWFRKLFGY